ncbi:saccharopine dehydrogenase NADP-binding domain-containing protein [Tsukamurella sp. 8F]|uniref:saccharopine dehydrogenase family protein n=1 Tax=unclassified Tsukamurella TaxID=2633480 RepID=UPI0023B8EF04|nr:MULTISPECIES: saccharopine dehydrogenase NADP-binding domain-containing protein [unclassified Tsukamurella]MDF0531636.1 saccharopine dehydrogenase NADP-binding domain-containing protein [Tsukamurella sp. 8J]MDF0588796.1 saccharopine dehydrogenase NADP-binding domain-containing protein [Tsukamurella sp. 8F]
MSDAREFDVIVFGATGFVGELTARHLAQHAPDDVRIALAGRTEAKLEQVRSRLGVRAAQWPLVIADVDSPSSLDAMAARTAVLCSTVGPYAQYGEAVVGACVNAGTHYTDLTGEVLFARRSIDKYHDQAVAGGVKIVHSCGFDSIPSDLGTWLLYDRAKTDDAGTLGPTTLVAHVKGGASGGTIASAIGLIDEVTTDREARRIATRPHSLTTDETQERPKQPSDVAVVAAAEVDPSLTGSLAPFFMAPYNTRVVRRSNALLDWAYGPDFTYRETMSVGRNPWLSTVGSYAVLAGMGVGVAAIAAKPLRPLLDRILPAPGSGPSEKAQAAGRFMAEVYTRTTSGRRYRSRVGARKDPGYSGTAVMLGEASLALALDGDSARGGAPLPDRHGVLTPAVALDGVLADRLRAQGFVVEVTELDQ